MAIHAILSTVFIFHNGTLFVGFQAPLVTPAPVEYIAEELGGEKFKTVCDDIYAVLKENELSVEQAEVMLEVVKARLKKIAKI